MKSIYSDDLHEDVTELRSLECQHIKSTEHDTIKHSYCSLIRGHGGRVVTLSSPTSEAGIRFPPRPQVGKLVVAFRWSAVYSTEP